MSEYARKQFVGIDLHGRRSVIVRATDTGDSLEVVRINNDVDSDTSRGVRRLDLVSHPVGARVFRWS